MTLQKQLDELKAGFKAQLPPETAAEMNRATQELERSGLVEKALKRGDRAPDFTLEAAGGGSLSLGDLIQDGPLVLTFYRGVW